MILDGFLSCFYVGCWICLWLVPPAVQGYADLTYINKSCKLQYLTDYIRHQKATISKCVSKAFTPVMHSLYKMNRKNTQEWGVVLYLHVLSTKLLNGFQWTFCSGGDSLLLRIFQFAFHWSNITCILLEDQIRMCKYTQK